MTTLLIAWGPGELRGIVLDGSDVLDLRIERDFSGSLIGARFVGRVAKSASALNAVFVELGLDQQGFLPLRGALAASLTEGQPIAVEVTKDPRERKPVELRFSPDQREAAQEGPVPRRLDTAKSAVERLLDSLDGRPLHQIIVNDAAVLLETRRILQMRQPDLVAQCRLEQGSDLFDRHGVADNFAAALAPVVALETGGTMTIESVTAATMIDIDLGTASARRGPPERAILATNLAAAREIGRQLRWRNLGGAIVIDFISMRRREHRQEVWDALKAATTGDSVPTELHGWTRLGHFELTRQRRRASLAEIVLDPRTGDPTPMTLALGALFRICFAPPNPGPITLDVSPRIGDALAGPLAAYLDIAAQRCGRKLIVTRQETQPDPVLIDGV